MGVYEHFRRHTRYLIDPIQKGYKAGEKICKEFEAKGLPCPIHPDEVVIVEPTGKHTHTLVYCPGYTMLGEQELAYMVDYYNIKFPNLKMVLLTARLRNITWDKSVRHAWFDYLRWTPPAAKVNRLINRNKTKEALELIYSEYNQTDLQDSVQAVKRVLEEEAKIVGMDHMLLGGESQGG